MLTPVSTTEFEIPGAYRSVRASFAPNAEGGSTKRGPEIAAQTSFLASEIEALETSTRTRNRELETHIEEIRLRGTVWEARVRQERDNFVDLVKAVREAFDRTVGRESRAEEDRAVSALEGLHAEVGDEESQCGQLGAKIAAFVGETIPAVIDAQSGEVSRKLKESRDALDIENAKNLKREQKIASNFSDHIARTAQAFEDERATRKAKFAQFQEDMWNAERYDDRGEERTASNVVDKIREVKEKLDLEVKTREKEDNTLLDAMIYAQTKLQAAVLKAFGTTTDA